MGIIDTPYYGVGFFFIGEVPDIWFVLTQYEILNSGIRSRRRELWVDWKPDIRGSDADFTIFGETD